MRSHTLNAVPSVASDLTCLGLPEWTTPHPSICAKCAQPAHHGLKAQEEKADKVSIRPYREGTASWASQRRQITRRAQASFEASPSSSVRLCMAVLSSLSSPLPGSAQLSARALSARHRGVVVVRTLQASSVPRACVRVHIACTCLVRRQNTSTSSGVLVHISK